MQLFKRERGIKMDIECPECGALNETDDVERYELITCWACGHAFEYDESY
jgi:lysine biosynthesis protein LysW